MSSIRPSQCDRDFTGLLTKTVPWRHFHRPAPNKQSLTETLFLRLWVLLNKQTKLCIIVLKTGRIRKNPTAHGHSAGIPRIFAFSTVELALALGNRSDGMDVRILGSSAQQCLPPGATILNCHLLYNCRDAEEDSSHTDNSSQRSDRVRSDPVGAVAP